MTTQDEIKIEKEDDDFGDIYDEANPDVVEGEVDVKAKNKFQKFIKKISRPS